MRGLSIWLYYIIYMDFTRLTNHILYNYVFEMFLDILFYVKGENQNILILDINDENTTYVFASESIYVAYLNLNIQ